MGGCCGAMKSSHKSMPEKEKQPQSKSNTLTRNQDGKTKQDKKSEANGKSAKKTVEKLAEDMTQETKNTSGNAEETQVVAVNVPEQALYNPFDNHVPDVKEQSITSENLPQSENVTSHQEKKENDGTTVVLVKNRLQGEVQTKEEVQVKSEQANISSETAEISEENIKKFPVEESPFAAPALNEPLVEIDNFVKSEPQEIDEPAIPEFLPAGENVRESTQISPPQTDSEGPEVAICSDKNPEISLSLIEVVTNLPELCLVADVQEKPILEIQFEPVPTVNLTEQELGSVAVVEDNKSSAKVSEHSEPEPTPCPVAIPEHVSCPAKETFVPAPVPCLIANAEPKPCSVTVTKPESTLENTSELCLKEFSEPSQCLAEVSKPEPCSIEEIEPAICLIQESVQEPTQVPELEPISVEYPEIASSPVEVSESKPCLDEVPELPKVIQPEPCLIDVSEPQIFSYPEPEQIITTSQESEDSKPYPAEVSYQDSEVCVSSIPEPCSDEFIKPEQNVEIVSSKQHSLEQTVEDSFLSFLSASQTSENVTDIIDISQNKSEQVALEAPLEEALVSNTTEIPQHETTTDTVEVSKHKSGEIALIENLESETFNIESQSSTNEEIKISDSGNVLTGNLEQYSYQLVQETVDSVITELTLSKSDDEKVNDSDMGAENHDLDSSKQPCGVELSKDSITCQEAVLTGVDACNIQDIPAPESEESTLEVTGKILKHQRELWWNQGEESKEQVEVPLVYISSEIQQEDFDDDKLPPPPPPEDILTAQKTLKSEDSLPSSEDSLPLPSPPEVIQCQELFGTVPFVESSCPPFKGSIQPTIEVLQDGETLPENSESYPLSKTSEESSQSFINNHIDAK